MKHFYLLITLGLISFWSHAQEAYTPLECRGEVPLDFLKTSFSKYQDAKENLDEQDKRSTKKLKEDFLLQSNYGINEFLESGRILFGDEITTYVNKVADELIKVSEDKELESLRFYVLKSSSINAFSTHQGIIFITTGLIAQLENESQLAFVLAHEIIHFQEKHSINKFVDTRKDEMWKSNNHKRLEKFINRQSQYSKEKEFEADELGFVLFSKTKYKLDESLKLLSVLQYSHLPFDNIEFDTTFFNTDFFKIPGNKFSAIESEETISFTDHSDEDDEGASHPNISRRKERIKEKIKDTDQKGTHEYLADTKEQFIHIRKISRLESLQTSLLRQDYYRVIYEGFLLKKNNPNLNYIDEKIALALYAYSKIRMQAEHHEEDYDDYISSITDHSTKARKKKRRSVLDSEGYITTLIDFLTNLNSKELQILALNRLTKLNDETLKPYILDIIYDLKEEHDLSKDYFYANHKELEKNTLLNESKQDSVIDPSTLSKIDRIEYYRKKQNTKLDYCKTALINQFSKSYINDAFNEDESVDEETSTKENIENIFILEPKQLTAHLKKGVNLVKSEKKTIEYNTMVESTCQNLDLKPIMYGKSNYTEASAERINQSAILKSWLGELSLYYNLGVLPTSKKSVQKIMDATQSKHVFLNKSVHIKVPYFKKRVATHLFSFLGGLPVMVYLIPRMIIPDYYNLHYTFVINLETGKVIYDDIRETKQNEQNIHRAAILHSDLYNIKNL